MSQGFSSSSAAISFRKCSAAESPGWSCVTHGEQWWMMVQPWCVHWGTDRLCVSEGECYHLTVPSLLAVLLLTFHLDFRDDCACCQLSERPGISLPPLLARGFFLCLLAELRIAVCTSGTVHCSVFTWCQSSDEEKKCQKILWICEQLFCSTWRAIFNATEICSTTSVAAWTVNSVFVWCSSSFALLEDELAFYSQWKTKQLWVDLYSKAHQHKEGKYILL